MFITSLIKVLCDKSVSEEARMMASIIFKNTLLNATQVSCCRWLKVQSGKE